MRNVVLAATKLSYIWSYKLCLKCTVHTTVTFNPIILLVFFFVYFPQRGGRERHAVPRLIDDEEPGEARK